MRLWKWVIKIPMSKLISGDELQNLLNQNFQNSKKEIIIISAFITEPAVNQFIKVIPTNVHVKLVCRLKPLDAANGSCSIPALKKVIENNWLTFRLENLHAKIYSIDNSKIYSGSANATANGLMIHTKGNIEACNEVSASPENEKFISNIFNTASPVDMQTLIDMEKYIEENKDTYKNNENLEWPEEILPENKSIWVRDFMVINELDKTSFENSKAVKWLIKKLKENDNNEMHFGKVTDCLHNDLEDDPLPYRSSIKELLANLILHIEKHLLRQIEVSRPNYRQVIKLLED